MLTTAEYAALTVEALRERALTAPRQESIFLTRYAAAKEANEAGDTVLAGQYLEAAKTALKRAMEDERGQELRAARTAAVVAEMGVEQAGLTSNGGKAVVKIRAERKAATWLDSWAR